MKFPPKHILGSQCRPRQYYGTIVPPAARHEHYSQQESVGSRAKYTAAPRAPAMVQHGEHERKEDSCVPPGGASGRQGEASSF